MYAKISVGLQEIFKVGDLTIKRKNQCGGNATVFKIAVHDKEYALKEFNKDDRTNMKLLFTMGIHFATIL